MEREEAETRQREMGITSEDSLDALIKVNSTPVTAVSLLFSRPTIIFGQFDLSIAAVG